MPLPILNIPECSPIRHGLQQGSYDVIDVNIVTGDTPVAPNSRWVHPLSRGHEDFHCAKRSLNFLEWPIDIRNTQNNGVYSVCELEQLKILLTS